ncbi:MAG: DUF2299 family protein [Candidatus Babeliales bacterium]
MDFSWLWQGILTNWIYWGIVAVVGLFGGLIRKKLPALWPMLFHGLLSSALAALIMICLITQHNLSIENQEKVTIENIQNKIRTWFDNAGYSTQPMPPNDKDYFQYRIVAPPNINMPIIVKRTKSRDHRLFFQITIVPSRDHKQIIDKLSNRDRDQLVRDEVVGMAQAGVYFEIMPSLEKCLLEQYVPITSTLTEDEVLLTVQTMERATLVFNAIFSNHLPTKKI